MSSIKKIYIDTRFKTQDSISDSDFKIQLPFNIDLPNKCAFYITDIVIPVSFYTVQTGVNDKLYIITNNDGSFIYWTITISSKNYTIATLAQELQNKLSNNFGGSAFHFSVSYDLDLNKISLVMEQSDPLDSFDPFYFKVATDYELQNGGWSGGTSIASPQSLNSILNNYTSTTTNGGATWWSGYVDFHPIRNLYLSSSNFGSFQTISVWRQDTIIKKIPISANYNELVIDNETNPYDFLSCDNQTLSLLHFQLKDSNGITVNLQNHWSFSIIFINQE